MRIGLYAEGIDAVQVGDSVSAAFCDYLKDSNDSSQTNHGCVYPQRLLKRLQLIGYLNGALPLLDADELLELAQHWTTCFQHPQEATSDELRVATNEWLVQRSSIPVQIDAFLKRLWKNAETAAGVRHLANGVMPAPIQRTNFEIPDIRQTAVLREWIRQLATRSHWTHLSAIEPGAASERLTEAFLAPRLQRRMPGHPKTDEGLSLVDEDLQRPLRCFEPICWITGEPGSGKSTLLQWLVHQLIHQESWPGLLPIAIDLRTYSDHCARTGYKTLQQYFFLSLDLPRELSVQIDQAPWSQLPPQPRCVFLLDEWSECDEPLRERVWQEVQTLSNHHKVIITSRVGETPLPTQYPHQLAEFTLSYKASSEDADRLHACHLQPTAGLVRAIRTAGLGDWQPTNFLARTIHCLWQRYNVLAQSVDQLKAAHWQVLESLALAMMEQPVTAPEFQAIDLERLCDQHQVSSLAIIRSRLISRSAREPTRMRFAQAGYLFFFAASAVTHRLALTNDAAISSDSISAIHEASLQRWTLSQSGPAAIAQIASADHCWKRRVMSLTHQAIDQSDLFGHRLLRLTDVMLVCTANRSSRRIRFISRLNEAFQRPCPAEVQQAYVQATESLQPIRQGPGQANHTASDVSIYSVLSQMAKTSFAAPEIDELLSSIADRAWPCGHEWLVEIIADTSLPDTGRQWAWRTLTHQPPRLMTPLLLDRLDALWTCSSRSAERSFNDRWKRIERMISTKQWLVVLRILADSHAVIDRPWLRWLTHEAPSIAVRLLAIETLGHAFQAMEPEQGRAEWHQCLLSLITAINHMNVDDVELSPAAWARLFDRMPQSLKEHLQDSPLRSTLLDTVNDFVHCPHAGRLPVIHHIAHLLALTYLPTDRTIGKRLIQTCMTMRGEAKQHASVSLRREIIEVWLAAMTDDDPETLYEFDFDHDNFRLALERIVWQRGWLLFDDRIVDRDGSVIGTRLLETEDWVSDEIPQRIQRIAQQLPDRQRADFLSFCQMIGAGDANYFHSTPEKIYHDMVLLLQAEVSGRVGERLQSLYPDAQPPTFESWRKNLRRVQQRYQHDPEITAHLRHLGLGVNKRRPR